MAERIVRESEQSVNYAMLSLFQYLASILVILVHCQRLFENEVLHFTQKSMFGRMAVPFFLTSSAFMLKSSLAKKQDMKLYVKRILKQYLLWSGIYVPYALSYFWTLPVQKHYAPLALLAGLLYIGLCYQLWYIPAFLLGLLLVHYVYRKWGVRKTGIFLLLLYVVGSIETYYAYFSHSWLTQSFDAYAKVFFTTRNGIFYTPIFIYLGYLLYDYRQPSIFRKDYGKKLFLSGLLLLLDGWIVFIHQGIDKNFFLALPLFALFLVNWILRTRIERFVFLFASDFYRILFLSAPEDRFCQMAAGKDCIFANLALDSSKRRSHFISSETLVLKAKTYKGNGMTIES